MQRLLTIGFTAMVAMLVGDIMFRTSLIRTVRPVITEPTDGAAVSPPVRLRWEGPQQMRVTLRYAGRETWDLGVRESPFEMPENYFSEHGLYSVEILSPVFGPWISTSRAFSAPGLETAAPDNNKVNLGAQLAALQKTLSELQTAQGDMREENTNLYEENAEVREENAILTEELNRIAEAEQRAAGQAAALQREHDRLAEEHRQLLEETNQLRLRLTGVIPCTVWGYFSYPRPQTIPPTRRIVTVSTQEGDVFRALEQCEDFRRRDSASASLCFCVGNSWGG